ncbi:MAG: hypothetical protein HY714_03040 [Candidatus Omnitrophica bacterium]|nr:hypothetical protein [Candidatus Omnitrophota bacterium]
MKKTIAFLILGAAVLLAGDPLRAETIEGNVVALNAGANTLTVSRVNPGTGAQEQVEVVVSPETRYVNAGSLSGLDIGDRVAIEAGSSAQAWKASQVEKKLAVALAVT